MKKKQTCVCNNCENEFEYKFEHEVISQNESGGDVIQYFIICPNCGSRFNSYIEDRKYREMLAHYRKLGKVVRKTVKQGANPAVIRAAINKMNNYEKNTMKPYYEELKNKYGNFGINNNDKASNDN